MRSASQGSPTVVLATPCFGGLVHQDYMLSVCKLMACAAEGGFALDLALLGGDALIARARSVLAARFLDTPGATHLLFVDADIVFEPAQVLRMLAFDKDFVAAFYPLKTLDWPAVPRRVVDGESLQDAGLGYVGTLLDAPQRRIEAGFATALYAGTGLQLVKRTVFERLIAAHPELRFSRLHTPVGAAPRSDNLYALYDCEIDRQTGTYVSEDFAFCRRWRAIGGDIWLDLGSRVGHVGAVTFQGDTSFRHRRLLGGPGDGDDT